jgi:hypothetical protein
MRSQSSNPPSKTFSSKSSIYSNFGQYIYCTDDSKNKPGETVTSDGAIKNLKSFLSLNLEVSIISSS